MFIIYKITGSNFLVAVIGISEILCCHSGANVCFGWTQQNPKLLIIQRGKDFDFSRETCLLQNLKSLPP